MRYRAGRENRVPIKEIIDVAEHENLNEALFPCKEREALPRP
jgi:hypothetical protein